MSLVDLHSSGNNFVCLVRHLQNAKQGGRESRRATGEGGFGNPRCRACWPVRIIFALVMWPFELPSTVGAGSVERSNGVQSGVRRFDVERLHVPWIGGRELQFP